MFQNGVKYVAVFLFSFFLLLPTTQARENVTDWYVQNLRAEYVLAPDSTMTVTEWITADCGQATGKHGILRTVPTEARTESGTIASPVELLGITDFSGKSYSFTTTENRSDATVTWKIGDPNTTVTGVHQYKILYRVKNVIRFGNVKFDEFYWNIGGHFWLMGIDTYQATILFPKSVSKDAAVSLYTGVLGSKGNDLAEAHFTNDQTLLVTARQSLLPGQGITLSTTVPKGIFTPYQASLWELYGKFLWVFFPIIIFIFCFRSWRKYGDDPSWNRTVIPEYEVPESLDTLSLGLLMKNGRMENNFVTAAIIELAVKGYIIIREEDEKILFFTIKEYILEKQGLPEESLLPHQKLILNTLFHSHNSVGLSTLKKKGTFSEILGNLRNTTNDSLQEKGLIEKRGLVYQLAFFILAVIIFIFTFVFGGPLNAWFAMFCGIASAAILFIFSFIMPKRTLRGAEVNWQIQGFKLYMETAEKYREQFNEKQNIFETLLPYAIVFDMTKEWIKKMQAIYGEEYFTSYHPAWMVGNLGNFNADSFTSQMESLSSSIAANTGTSSGSGGSGSSGGGGGGGGGGGW
jgi:uncharacterized membrane protein YgcG